MVVQRTRYSMLERLVLRLLSHFNRLTRVYRVLIRRSRDRRYFNINGDRQLASTNSVVILVVHGRILRQVGRSRGILL